MSDNRLHYLDGLRGVLAAIVFAHHFIYAFCPNVFFGGDYRDFMTTGWNMYKIVALTPINIIFNPGTAINFFFLLSGYVQTYNYFKTPNTAFIQKSFIKRYFRLALPTMAVLVLIFAFHKLHLFNKHLIPGNPATGTWVKSMMPDNLTFLKAIKYGLFDCFNGSTQYYQVLWTMPVELYNSWMIMILLLVTHNLKNRMGVFVLWLLVQFFLLQTYYGVSFMIGMIICDLQVNSLKFKKLFSESPLKYISLLVGLYFATYPFSGYQTSTEKSVYRLISIFDTYPHVISYVIGNTLLFCVLLNAPKFKAFLSHKIFLFFGNISFMFYLTHFMLVFSFSPWMYHQLLPLGRGADLALTCITTFGIITAVSYLLYRLVDKPVINMTNIYAKKLFGV